LTNLPAVDVGYLKTTFSRRAKRSRTLSALDLLADSRAYLIQREPSGWYLLLIYDIATPTGRSTSLAVGLDEEVRRVETLPAQVMKQPLIGWFSTEGNLIKLIQVYEKLEWPIDCLFTKIHERTIPIWSSAYLNCACFCCYS